MRINLAHSLHVAGLFLLLACLGITASGRVLAAERAFTLSGVTLALEEVSTNVDVIYTSMRFNRALNVWNVEASLSNRSSRALSGPMVLVVESFTGTSGPLQPDGTANGVPASPFFDFSTSITNGELGAREASPKRTLTLGFQSGAAPQLITRVYGAGSPKTSALGLVVTLDETGQPLGAVEALVTGPDGKSTNKTDAVYGIATLGGGSGTNTIEFRAKDYLPVWRQQIFNTNEVTVVPFPRLTRRSTHSVTLTPIAGGQLSNATVQITISPGVVSSNTPAVLTPLTGQSLPALLPVGWSPLQAFCLESDPSLLSASVTMRPWGPFNPGQTGALVKWNTNELSWDVAGLITSSGTDLISTTLPGPGTFAVVVGDSSPLAPPAAQAGQFLLPSSITLPSPGSLSAGGEIRPTSSPASRVPEVVTATAEVLITNGFGNLSSGVLFQCAVNEQYRLRDGTMRATPRYENFIIGYQRPGDDRLNTLNVTFPVRPLLLFGADELEEALVRVDVLNPEPFTGGVLQTNGGQLVNGDLRLLSGAGDVAEPQGGRLRLLSPTNFTDLVVSNLTVLRAFDLSIGGIVAGRHLALQLQGLPTNAFFVLARVLIDRGVYGLEPVERLASDSLGRLNTLETNATDHLPGITGAGQYLLLRVAQPQALVKGVARNSANQPLGGLVVRLAPWLTISREPDGFFQILSSSGTANVVVSDRATGDSGQTDLSVSDPNTISTANISTILEGPRVISISPTNSATAVSRVVPVKVTFSKPISPGSLGANGIVLFGTNAQPVFASLSLNLNGTFATLLPVDPLAPGTRYTVVVSTNLSDLSGRRIESPTSSGFTTESDALNRVGGRLTIYEPTNGLAPLFGSPGTADPEAPVILVNETTGETATVLSKPDGSFTNFLAASVDDFLSAVLVNQNGTRNTIPASRQIFRDGRVGLFRGGGILEAESDGGPVQVIVEPGAIPAKTKFELEAIPLGALLALLGTAVPEDAKLLGGFRFSVDGDALRQSADIKFPADPRSFNLTNMAPEDAAFALCEVVEVDGVKMHRMVDRMKYREGHLVTSSPPFEGLGAQANIGGGLIPGVLANYSIFLLKPSAVVVGRVIIQPQDDLTPVTAQNAPLYPPVAGAIVSTAGVVTGPGLRPGGIITRTQKNGFYAFQVPIVLGTNGIEAISLKAQSPRFPGKVAFRTFLPFPGSVAEIVNLVFRVPTNAGGFDVTAPILSIQHPPVPLPLNSNIAFRINALDNASFPMLTFANWLNPNNSDQFSGLVSFSLADGSPLDVSDVTLTQLGLAPGATSVSGQNQFTINVKKPAKVFLAAAAQDLSGNTKTQLFELRFAQSLPLVTSPIQSHDSGEQVPPQVVSITPSSGVGVSELKQITLRFSEAVNPAIQGGNGVLVSGSVSGVVPVNVELAADQLSAIIRLPLLAAGEEVTLTLSGDVQDLNGNSLPPFSANWQLVSDLQKVAGGLDNLVGSVIHGTHSFALDRTTSNDGALRVYRLNDPAGTTPVASIPLPPFPRAITLIPRLNFKRTPSGPVESKPLLMIGGGLLGTDNVGQWVRLVDISQPEAPVRLASTLGTIDFAAAINIIKADGAFAYLAINTPEGGDIYKVNLQSFIFGSTYSEIDWQAAMASGPMPGTDANGDGDFVDPGDVLPVPQRHAFPGLDFALHAEDRRFISDFDVRLGGAFMAAVFSSRGSLPSRLQVITYGGQIIGLGNDNDGSAPIALPATANRVLLEENFLFTATNGQQTISLAAVVAVGRSLRIYDVSTDPVNPSLIHTVNLPADAGSILAIARNASEYLVGTAGKAYLIDRELMGKVFANVPPDQAHPSVSSPLPLRATGRTMGLSDLSLAGASDNGLRLIVRAPKLSVIRIPNLPVLNPFNLIDHAPEAEAALNGAVPQNFLLPSPLISVGTNFPSAIATPPNPAAHYYVLLRGPGQMGSTVRLMVESLDRNGERKSPHGPLFAPALLTDFANTFGFQNGQLPVTALVAYRLSSNTNNPLFNVYLSAPLLFVRDSYSAAIHSVVQSFAGRQAVLVGDQLRVSVETVGSLTGFDYLENTPGSQGIIKLSTTVPAFCADFVDSANPAFGNAGPVLEGVTVQSGEFRYPSTDLMIEGRLQHLLLVRTYESQTHFAGPFGRGWDFNFNRRLCELPVGLVPQGFALPLVLYSPVNPFNQIAHPGDVLLQTGDGDVKLFQRIQTENNNVDKLPLFQSDPAITEFGWVGKIAAFYVPPPGEFDALFRFTDGEFVLVNKAGGRTFYDAAGRLKQIVAPYEASKITLSYRGDGKLDRVSGDRGIDLEFGYFGKTTSPDFRPLDKPFSGPGDLGLIARVKAGTENVEYKYDSQGNLVTFVGALGTVTYGYDPQPPHQLSSIGREDGTKPPGQRITYINGLVSSVSVNGVQTTFSGGTATAAERQAAGNSSVTVNRAGNSAHFDVDPHGRPKSFAGNGVVSDQDGRITSFTKGTRTLGIVFATNSPVYRFRDNVEKIISGSYETTVTYDQTAFNRVKTKTSPDGVTTLYSYAGDEPGTIITLTTGPNVREYRFDPWGNLTKEELREGGVTFRKTVLFDAAEGLPKGIKLGDLPALTHVPGGSHASSFAAGAFQTTPAFSAEGLFKGISVAGGLEVGFGYDNNSGRENSFTVSAGNKSIEQTITPDPAQPQFNGTVATAETGLPAQNAVFGYDGQARLTTMSLNGVQTTIGYSGLTPTEITTPNLHRKFTYNAGSIGIKEQGVSAMLTLDGEGRASVYESQGGRRAIVYSVADRQQSITMTDTFSGGVLFSETYGHDSVGRLSSVTSGGTQWIYTYFPDNSIRSVAINGIVIQSFTRNTAGLLTEMDLFGGRQVTTFDDFHEVTAQPKLISNKGLDGTLRTTALAYDLVGRLTSITEAGELVTTIGYDTFGRVEKVTDPDSVTVRYEFSPSGVPLKKTFGDSTSITWQYNPDITPQKRGDISYTYDNTKQPATVTFPDGSLTTFTARNQHFEPTSITLGAVSQIHTYTDGRVTRIESSQTGDLLTFEYDGLGRHRQVTLNGYSTSFGYDQQHGRVSETGPLGTWSIALTPLGGVSQEKYPSGLTINYALDSQILPMAATAVGLDLISWADLGRPLMFQFTNGITVTRSYDASRRINKISYGKGAATVAEFEYGLTPGGRVMFEKRPHENASDVYVRNAPAKGMRISGVLFSAGTTNATNSLVSITGLNYDSNSEISFVDAQANSGQVRTIIPASNDHLTTNSQGAAGSGPVWVNLNGSPQRFDARFFYDAFVHLKRVERLTNGAVAVTVDYQRDGLGRVVRKTVVGPPDLCRPGDFRYSWKDDKLIEEYQVPSSQPLLTRRYIYIGEHLVSVQSSRTPGGPLRQFVPLVNLVGSVCGYLDENGALAEFIRYGLYGLPENIGLVSGQLFPRSDIGGTVLFQGAYFDEETGLYHLGERVLHPVFGRFLQRDSELYEDSRALYLAFNGDPASYVDAAGTVAGKPVGTTVWTAWNTQVNSLDDFLNGGAAETKGVLYRDRGAGQKFFLSKNSKVYDLASKLVGTASGLVPSQYQELAKQVETGLKVAKYAVAGLEEWRDWNKSKLHYQRMLAENFHARGEVGRATEGWLKSGVGRKDVAQKLRQRQNLEKDLLFAKYDNWGNAVSAAKVGVGLGKIIVKDWLHWQNQDDKLKYVGMLDATAAALDFTKLTFGARIASNLERLATSAAERKDVVFRLSGGGGYWESPVSKFYTRALVAYQAFDLGFTFGKGATTAYLGLVDPDVARDYYEATRAFERDGGFGLHLIGGVLDSVGASQRVVESLRNMADTTFVPSLPEIQAEALVSPPFELYYRGLDRP